MLHHGLYEQVINNRLNSELSEIPEARKAVAPIDRAEASKVLAQYLADVVQKGLDNVADNGGDISAQIALTNQIVDLIHSTTREADFAALGVDQRAEQLLALLRETDPRLAVGKTAADLSRPETSIAQSSLFTGAIHEPQMYTELKKEIVSADRIDMLVSFIKWSGLRLLMDELREFTQNGGGLRIITTSYMGATDVKAIEELRQLPNTKIKVSYDTKRTRLHAKTYVYTKTAGEKMVEVVAALIWDNKQFMICQRPAHKARALMWEFVGGKVELGETKEQALIRECQEELGITLSVGDTFMDVVHEYPDITIRLTLFNATIADGIPQKLEHNDIRWITVEEIDHYSFCPADTEILLQLKQQQ